MEESTIEGQEQFLPHRTVFIGVQFHVLNAFQANVVVMDLGGE